MFSCFVLYLTPACPEPWFVGFARVHREPREESLIFHRIGRYRFDESTQHCKRVKTSNSIFCRGHEAYGESVSPRFSINIYFHQLPLYLCVLCVRHLYYLVVAMLRCELFCGMKKV